MMHAPDTPQLAAAHSRIQRWTIALLLLGLAWRLLRYCLRFPVWGDEAYVCMNLADRDYAGLLGPLRHHQVAPILFLWGERAALQVLGSSELALRLLPFLAGLGALVLFWRIAQLTLAPLPRLFAVGFLAVAIWPVSMTSNIKPYSLDLFMPCALLWPAAEWLRQPDRLRWLLLLALIVPIALFASFPVVFVAGAVSVGLLVPVWREQNRRALALFLAYNVLLVGGFLANYLLIARAQTAGTGEDVGAFMRWYWANGFPPAQPLPLAEWFVLIHTGRMMAYPIGGSDGQSTLTFLLFVCGVWATIRQRRGELLALLLCPFALGLIAAAVRAYPYGGCCRISQHLAPSVCLLAGTGAAALLERSRSSWVKQHGPVIVFGLFAAVGTVGMFIDVLRPYRVHEDVWKRQVVREVASRCGPSDQLVVLNRPEEVNEVMAWELLRCRRDGLFLGWDGAVDDETLRSTTGQVWVFDVNGTAPGLDELRASFARSGRTWVLTHHIPFATATGRRTDPVYRCDVYRWICSDGPNPPDPLPFIPCSP